MNKFYKVTRPDGLDFYSGTVNYRRAIGTTLVVPGYKERDVHDLCSHHVLHASCEVLGAMRYAKIPCAIFQVTGKPVNKQDDKCGFTHLRVVKEYKNLDRILGFKYSEAINPINPFKLLPPTITKKHIGLVEQWANVWDSACPSVWDSVWDSVRDSVWDSVRNSVRDSVRDSVWDSVRDSVWDSACPSVWDSVRDSACPSVWDSVRNSVREGVWNSVGAYTSSLFPDIQKWEYIDHPLGENPFTPCIKLWRMGLVPSFDGKTWRLHGGPDGGILWTQGDK